MAEGCRLSPNKYRHDYLVWDKSLECQNTTILQHQVQEKSLQSSLRVESIIDTLNSNFFVQYKKNAATTSNI